MNQQKPDKEETVQFWTQLCNNPRKCNKNAAWIKEVYKNKKESEMKQLEMTVEMVEKLARDIKNWLRLDENDFHAFWLKLLIGLHLLITK